MGWKPPLVPDTFVDDFNTVGGASDRAARFGTALAAGGSNLLDVLAALVTVSPHVTNYLTAHPNWDSEVLAVMHKVATTDYHLGLVVVTSETHGAAEIRILDDDRETAVIVVYSDPSVDSTG
jgi:hypothetical protein